MPVQRCASTCLLLIALTAAADVAPLIAQPIARPDARLRATFVAPRISRPHPVRFVADTSNCSPRRWVSRGGMIGAGLGAGVGLLVASENRSLVDFIGATIVGAGVGAFTGDRSYRILRSRSCFPEEPRVPRPQRQ